MKVYKQVGEKSVRLLLVEANCGLAHLCLKMGEWAEGKKYLCEAEGLIGKEKKITVCHLGVLFPYMLYFSFIGLLSI